MNRVMVGPVLAGVRSSTGTRTTAGTRRLHVALIVGIVAVQLGLSLWTIGKDLPYKQEVDEDFFVRPAMRIAATRGLNPGWFGHPGSTVIYPLAATYRVWNHVAYGGNIFDRADQNIQARFDADPAEFFLIGRLLVALYAAGSVPLVYLLGRRAFGPRIGLVGAFLSAFYPLTLNYAQVVRTDTAGLFFAVLSLWLCLRLYVRPTMKNQILAGLALGLSIATRYLMVALVPVLLAVDLLILWRHARLRKPVIIGAAVGLLAVGVAFALSTPYFFLDFQTVLKNYVEESSPHPEAYGLSRRENFVWYLTAAIPQGITWVQLGFAALGIFLATFKRRPEQLLLLLFVFVYLIGISFSNLHWARWVIQTLPLFGLFAAAGLLHVAGRLKRLMRIEARRSSLALNLATVILVFLALVPELMAFQVRHSNPSTRMVAREWIVQNLPSGSRIATDWFGAPLGGTDFSVLERWSLAGSPSPAVYLREGYRYLVVTSNLYQPYLANPRSFPTESSFYRTLFADGRLLHEVQSSSTRRGPTIRIYELTGPFVEDMLVSANQPQGD